jgi:alpha-methylacyl-CoA racemase
MNDFVPPGPLQGLKVVHLASLGPGPYAAMLLADMGCDVVIVDRTVPTATSVPPARDPRRRGQRSVALDLKDPQDFAALLKLVGRADVLIEGMRPGVAERLGLGPDQCLGLNPRLIYARMTGWGQEGSLSPRAGHDINYIALSGALEAMGEKEGVPPVPLNLLGDYAGGGMYLVVGILAALMERQKSGLGQVVDGAIADGVASLCATTFGILATGGWKARGTNVFDGSTPWYAVYRTKDGRFVAVGAIEQPFYEQLLAGVGLNPAEWHRDDAARVARLKGELESRFLAQDRAYWEMQFADTDACVSPVLSFTESLTHPYHQSRGTYTVVGDVSQPAPGPRLSRTPFPPPGPPPERGEHTDEIRRELRQADSKD